MTVRRKPRSKLRTCPACRRMLKPKERYANIAEGHLHWIPAPSMKDGEGQTIARGRATGILDGEPVDPNWLEPVLVREGLQN